MRNELIAGVITMGVIIGVILFFGSMTIIKTGEIGITTRFGAVQERVLEEGMNFQIPFIEGVIKMNCKIQRAEQQLAGATKDLQDVDTYIVYNYQIDKVKAPKLYKEIGSKYIDILVTPMINNIVKTNFSLYNAEEIITKRAELTNTIIKELNEKLSSYGITINELTISNVAFSEAYTNAIEQKQVAEQEAKKSQQELEKVKAEAEQKIVQAQAEAEALRIQNQEVTSEVLKLREIEARVKAIEKWNGVLPTYTGSTVPFLNIN